MQANSNYVIIYLERYFLSQNTLCNKFAKFFSPFDHLKLWYHIKGKFPIANDYDYIDVIFPVLQSYDM